MKFEEYYRRNWENSAEIGQPISHATRETQVCNYLKFATSSFAKLTGHKYQPQIDRLIPKIVGDGHKHLNSLWPDTPVYQKFSKIPISLFCLSAYISASKKAHPQVCSNTNSLDKVLTDVAVDIFEDLESLTDKIIFPEDLLLINKASKHLKLSSKSDVIVAATSDQLFLRTVNTPGWLNILSDDPINETRNPTATLLTSIVDFVSLFSLIRSICKGLIKNEVELIEVFAVVFSVTSPRFGLFVGYIDGIVELLEASPENIADEWESFKLRLELELGTNLGARKEEIENRLTGERLGRQLARCELGLEDVRDLDDYRNRLSELHISYFLSYPITSQDDRSMLTKALLDRLFSWPLIYDFAMLRAGKKID